MNCEMKVFSPQILKSFKMKSGRKSCFSTCYIKTYDTAISVTNSGFSYLSGIITVLIAVIKGSIVRFEFLLPSIKPAVVASITSSIEDPFLSSAKGLNNFSVHDSVCGKVLCALRSDSITSVGSLHDSYCVLKSF